MINEVVFLSLPDVFLRKISRSLGELTFTILSLIEYLPSSVILITRGLFLCFCAAASATGRFTFNSLKLSNVVLTAKK
jgi:hypothetical protein